MPSRMPYGGVGKIFSLLPAQAGDVWRVGRRKKQLSCLCVGLPLCPPLLLPMVAAEVLQVRCHPAGDGDAAAQGPGEGVGDG